MCVISGDSLSSDSSPLAALTATGDLDSPWRSSVFASPRRLGWGVGEGTDVRLQLSLAPVLSRPDLLDPALPVSRSEPPGPAPAGSSSSSLLL